MINHKSNLRTINKKLESTATGREVQLIVDFAKDILDHLNDDWELVDSSFGCPAALLHIPTNTTYHIDADATSSLNDKGYLKVVFAEQPNSVGSTYTSGSCYTFDADHAVKLLKFNAKRMEKWLERHYDESMKRDHLEQRITRLEKLLSKKVRSEARMPKNVGDAMVNAIYNRDTDKALKLLEAGADPNCMNKHGMSALYAAINNHNLVVAKALLEAGADPNEMIESIGEDWYGDGEDIVSTMSLLELAEEDDNDRMVALLKQYGAR